MSNNKEIKSVAFNKSNPQDELMLKHVSRRNFSGYVKKLIFEDMKKKCQEEIAEQIPNEDKIIPSEKLSAADRLKLLKQQKSGQ